MSLPTTLMIPTSPTTKLKIKSLTHLANQLSLDRDLLLQLAEDSPKYYKEFDKSVKGKKRHLVHATEKLARVQRRILNRILSRLPVMPFAFGAIKGRSIRENAQIHATAKYIAKFDIKKFYPSIHYSRIYSFFMSQDCTPDVARILTRLTTRKHSLPLGTSTSPMLADQIIRNLDYRIGGIAQKLGLNYTRYVDDITISGDFPLKQFADKIRFIINQEGFSVKRKKVIFYEPKDGQERVITGVRIKRNGKLSVPIDYISELESSLKDAATQSHNGRVTRDFDGPAQYLGRIHHIKWLDPNLGVQLLKLYRKVKWKRLERAMNVPIPLN